MAGGLSAEPLPRKDTQCVEVVGFAKVRSTSGVKFVRICPVGLKILVFSAQCRKTKLAGKSN